jgi:hypothetical protein
MESLVRAFLSLGRQQRRAGLKEFYPGPISKLLYGILPGGRYQHYTE